MPAGRMFLAAKANPARFNPSPSVKKDIAGIKKSIQKINRNVELKFVDVLQNQNVTETGGSLQLLNNVVEGDDQSTRNGDEISATSIQFRGYFTNDQSLTALLSTAPVIRLLVFWDRQPNGAAPTIGSTAALPGLLDNSVITDFTMAPYNRSVQKRYKVLYDRTFVMPEPGFSSTSSTPFNLPAVRMAFNKKISLNRVVKYDATGNGIADIDTNSLYSVALVDSGTTTDYPTIRCGYRFYFKDS